MHPIQDTTAQPAASRSTRRPPRGAACDEIAGDMPLDAEYVVYRLEEAGKTLLALPSAGFSPRLRTSAWDVLRSSLEGYGWSEARIRPAVPAARQITRMDEALSWIALIPRDRYVLRRIVGARALVSPVTERHLYTWRRLGALLGADHKAIQRWHAQAVALIVAGLAATRDRHPNAA